MMVGLKDILNTKESLLKRLIKLITLLLGILLFLLAIRISYLLIFEKNNNQKKLESLRQDQALEVVYPDSSELLHSETPAHTGESGFVGEPSIVAFFGSQHADKVIKDYYKVQLNYLGWKYSSEGEEIAYRYSRLTFTKDERTFELSFWRKDDFAINLPNIDINKFNTVYQISLNY